MDQIERKVARMIDHLDRLFMAGQIDQKTYDSAMTDLRQWEDCEISWSEAEARARRRA
jgi:hypothetical protein